jgi:thiol-disulfide isomerase/thioredoxin
MQKILSLVALSSLVLLAGAGCAKDLRVNELDGKMEKSTTTPTNTMMDNQTKNDEKNNDPMMKNDSAKMEKGVDDNQMENKDTEDKAMMDKKPTSSMMKEDDTKMMKQGTYQNFSSDKLALAKTEKVVLFFKAGWCPTCKGVDSDITSHLNQIPKNVNILVVDYDASTDLKKKYGVTYQHTFVQIDSNGMMLKKWSGSQTLTELVKEIK